MSETRPPYITSEGQSGETIDIQEDATLPNNTWYMVSGPFKQSLVEQRQAALQQANALGRLLDLPDVCPCCGRRKK